jgi:hypothetical protein
MMNCMHRLGYTLGIMHQRAGHIARSFRGNGIYDTIGVVCNEWCCTFDLCTAKGLPIELMTL